MTLEDTFYKVLDEDNYPLGSTADFARDMTLIVDVLKEVDFLYSRGILETKKLGRLIDIIQNGGWRPSA